MTKNVLVIALAGHPSARLRILQYVPHLEDQGLSLDVCLVSSSRLSVRETRELRSQVKRADVVFVQRVANTPLGVMLTLSDARVVYDIDDALHYIRLGQLRAAQTPDAAADKLRVLYRSIVRGSRYYGSRRWPVEAMMRASDVAIAGNRFLGDELGGSAKQVVTLPTCIFVNENALKEHSEQNVVRLGWIGTSGNFRYLEQLEDVFGDLARSYGKSLRLTIVSSAAYHSKHLESEFIRWSLLRESDSILRFDIGLMPLKDDLFAQGKCAFKAVLCMAHRIPTVISPVGMNTDVIDHGKNGFLARTRPEWVDCLSRLIEDYELRARQGEEALNTVRARFSGEYATSVLRSAMLGEIAS